MRARDIFIFLAGALVIIVAGPAVMLAIAWQFPSPFLPEDDYVSVLGSLVSAVGLYFFIWSNQALVKYGKGGAAVIGRVRLMTETKHLVTEGPYALCRNPMHLSMVLYYCGVGVSLNNLVAMIVPIFVIIFAFVMAVFFDEPRLKRDFGEEYENWAMQVPRFLPRIRPYNK